MKLFFSIAERSASNYVYHIFKEIKGIEFYGITDERLESIGFRSLRKIDDFSVVGVWEAIPKIPKVLSFFREFEGYIREFDALILCDAPALNIPLLKRAKGKVRKIIYFISPQVWAWKEERAKVIAQYVDHLIVLFPFELNFYQKYERKGFNIHFVGHPLVDLAKPTLGEREFKNFLGFNEYVAILPGSRWSEIKRHVDYIKEVYAEIWRDFKLPAVVPIFDNFKEYIQERFKGLPAKIVTPSQMENPSYNSMAYAKASLVASGTADLEASLLNSPHVTYYRVNPITYWIGKRVIKVPYISLTNLILGKGVVPEIVQMDTYTLYISVKELLEDEEKRKWMTLEFENLKSYLGREGVLEKLRKLFMSVLSDN